MKQKLNGNRPGSHCSINNDGDLVGSASGVGSLDQDEGSSCRCNISPFVLLFGLGTHALFEGLALGIEPQFDKAAILGLAIALHKGPAGVSLGISMQRAFPEKRPLVVGMMALFSTFSPLGVALGMLLQGGNELAEIVVSSISGGTFLYIACSEILVEEFSKREMRYGKLAVFCVGIAMITSLHLLRG